MMAPKVVKRMVQLGPVKKLKMLEIAPMIRASTVKTSVECLRAKSSSSCTETPSLSFSVSLFLLMRELLLD